MTKIELETRVGRVAGQVSGDLDGETVTMSIASGKYYAMAGAGTRIWELLEETRTVAEICGLLQSEYEIERETCEAEVLRYLAQLASEGLLSVHDAEAP